MNTYEQQANDFLKATNTTFKAEFIKNDYHFQGDESTRDIYKCTFKRGNRQFSIEFGNSLINSGFYYTKGKQIIELDRKYLDKTKYNNLANFIKGTLDFNFLNNGKSDILHYPKSPTAYDVLTCLEKYEYQDFEDFCSTYGYDLDSRKAKKIYKACVKEFANVCKLWNDEEIELLQEIQ